jgi:hypothetical protein
MSGKPISPGSLVEEQTTAETSAGIEADPNAEADEFPFESAEFGVGGFLPHLDGEASR